jgi:hypothetical protein
MSTSAGWLIAKPMTRATPLTETSGGHLPRFFPSFFFTGL